MFVHVLVGAESLTGSALGLSVSQNSIAVAFGGGVQAKITEHWAFRPTFDYLLTHHNILGGPRIDQNNFRVGAGVAYTFGASAR